ncbi:MAG: MFS transporter [Bacillus sp. (in: Bacteria)]|nr:MFS transporter [Bacillus sp. (in: firmicutes)]
MFFLFLLAVGEACYGPARISSIPVLVKQERLIHINGIEQMMVGVILVLGSSTGGIISHFFGTHIPFVLNGVTFLLSAIILLRIIIPVPKKQKTTQLQMGNGISLKQMFKYTALASFFIIAITMPLANGIDNVLMSIYALDVFGMGDLGVGFIYASLGLGFIVSSFFF